MGVAWLLVMLIGCGVLSLACAPSAKNTEPATEAAAPAPAYDPFPSMQFGHDLTRTFTVSALADAEAGSAIRTPLARRITISYTPEQFTAFAAKVPLLAKIDPTAVRTAEFIFLDISRLTRGTAGTAEYISELQAAKIYLQLTGPEGDLFQKTDYLSAGLSETYRYDRGRDALLIGRDLVFGTK